MAHPERLAELVQRVTAQVRWRRAEHHGLRGLSWGALAGAVLLLFRAPLGAGALAAALGAAGIGLLAGAVWGFSRRVSAADAARLADRAWGLQDRVATALEWAARPDRTPLVDPLVADATARVAALERRQIVRRILPREARWLPVPLVAGLVLALAPPVSIPLGRLPDLLSASTEQEEPRARGEMAMLDKDRRPLPRDPLRRPAFEERDFAQRTGSGAGATGGDLNAIFKDTSLATQRPDFNSFLKKGDERLKLLERVDRLPDLQSDYTSSQYKIVFRKSKALRGGLRPDQISPTKLRELLEEMERLGRKGGNWSGDAAEGMEALEYGQQDKALEALEKALNKMRALEEQQRGGRNLRGGREADRGSGRDRGRGGANPDEMDFGEGEGSLPGRGRSASPKGDPSQRLRASPYDVGVEGEMRRGRKEGYDTNMTGRGGKMPSRLAYLGIIGQYRKMMEDSIAREQVPRDYHSQIKDYFQALDER